MTQVETSNSAPETAAPAEIATAVQSSVDRRPEHWGLVATLFLIPAACVALKQFGASGFEWLNLEMLPDNVKRNLGHVLFLPLGALLVVIFRLTLGLRVLGPFRSILLALAFQVTGIVLGLVFMALVIAAVVGLRGPIRKLRVPYFARVSILLTVVAGSVIVALLLGAALQADALYSVAFFPLVVLCLTADGFAKVLDREGPRQAVWRVSVTALAAVMLTGLAAVPGLKVVLLRYPELLPAQIGLIFLVSRFMAFRKFEYLNPKPKHLTGSAGGPPPSPAAAVPPLGDAPTGPVAASQPEPQAVSHEDRSSRQLQ